MEQKIIKSCQAFVQQELKNAEGGHDWFHVERVWKLAKTIARKEKVNLFIVELGALLHDIADYKFYGGDTTVGPRKAKEFLQQEGVNYEITEHVFQIIKNVSFSARQEFYSPELAVVQDADRLDAMGAIGIARTFNYGGFKGNQLYNPAIKPNPIKSKAEYKKGNSPTINHFYEKLLLLKGQMNTKTGKDMALARHEFMEAFLEQFYLEWNGDK